MEGAGNAIKKGIIGGRDAKTDLEEHLQDTFDATFRWLMVENNISVEEQELALLNFSLSYEAPEIPDILLMLRRLRRFNLSFSTGGLEDQPYLLMLELEQASMAENSYQAWQLARLKKDLEPDNAGSLG